MSEKYFPNSLEQFISLAKNLNDLESAIDLVKKVIDSPVVYSFSEILEISYFASVRKKNLFLMMLVKIDF